MFRSIMAALILAALLWCANSDAAVTVNSAVTAQTPKSQGTSYIQGTDSAGTYKTIYSGGTNGSKIIGIYVTSTDGSTAHLVTIQLSSSTSSHCSTSCYGGAAVTIPVNAGSANGAPAINMMSAANWPGLPIDATSNPFLFISGNTFTLEATFASSLTSSTQINIVVIAADF